MSAPITNRKHKAGGDSPSCGQGGGASLLSPPRPAALAPSNWIAQRQARIAAAIRFLKTQAVLVDQIDKRHQIPAFWVSGLRQPQLAEDVIALAIAKGWSE